VTYPQPPDGRGSKAPTYAFSDLTSMGHKNLACHNHVFENRVEVAKIRLAKLPIETEVIFEEAERLFSDEYESRQVANCLAFSFLW